MTPEQAQGWGWAEAIHPDDRERLVEEWQSSLASGTPVDTEARIQGFDSSYRWFLIRANPLRDESGKILKWCGTCIDIEDRKRAEEALRARELDARSLLDNMPGFLARISPDFTPEIFNRPFLQYLGKTEEEMSEWRVNDIGVHPDDLARTIEVISNMISSGQPSEHEYRLRGCDGVYRWFLACTVPERNPEGEILHWNSLVTDIDDRKKAEAQLEQALTQLTEAQRLSQTGSFTWDLLADEHTWSSEIYRIFGFEPGIKVTMQMVQSAIYPEDIPAVETTIGRAAEGADFDLPFRLVTPSGALKHIYVVGHRVERIADRPVFVGAIQDVSESKKAEEALNRARSELAHMARVTTLSALTTSIAHEINQPIAAVTTSAGACLRWLNRDQPDVQRAREAAMRIEDDGRRAAEIISHLRSFYKKDV